MDETKNIISSQAKLSAIAGMMFFAPLVKRNIKSDPLYSDEEREFIYGYVRVGYFNIIVLVIVILAALLNFVVIETIFSWIIIIGSIVLFLSMLMWIFACAGEIWLRTSQESAIQNIQNKNLIAKSFAPIVNFSLRYRLKDYSKPYRWLKESVLLRTIFIFWTLIFWTYFWIVALWVIFIRFVLLLCNVDVVPLSVKKALNSTFICNPEEMISYLSALLSAKWKKMEYNIALAKEKEKYQNWQSLWVWIVLQYIIFFAILYLLHSSINLWWEGVLLLISAVLWLIRVIIFYVKRGALLRIPIIAEIVSLVF